MRRVPGARRVPLTGTPSLLRAERRRPARPPPPAPRPRRRPLGPRPPRPRAWLRPRQRRPARRRVRRGAWAAGCPSPWSCWGCSSASV
ncbi:hypothetical protein B1B07_01810 [Kocuria marina subsp. indica]|nr:hypothetical protein B1B07_01810 [Kocuria indica]